MDKVFAFKDVNDCCRALFNGLAKAIIYNGSGHCFFSDTLRRIKRSGEEIMRQFQFLNSERKGVKIFAFCPCGEEDFIRIKELRNAGVYTAFHFPEEGACCTYDELVQKVVRTEKALLIRRKIAEVIEVLPEATVCDPRVLWDLSSNIHLHYDRYCSNARTNLSSLCVAKALSFYSDGKKAFRNDAVLENEEVEGIVFEKENLNGSSIRGVLTLKKNQLGGLGLHRRPNTEGPVNRWLGAFGIKMGKNLEVMIENAQEEVNASETSREYYTLIHKTKAPSINWGARYVIWPDKEKTRYLWDQLRKLEETLHDRDDEIKSLLI